MFNKTTARRVLTLGLYALVVVTCSCLVADRDVAPIAPNNQQAENVEGDQSGLKLTAVLEAALARFGDISAKFAESIEASASQQTGKKATSQPVDVEGDNNVVAPENANNDTNQAGAGNIAISIAGGVAGGLTLPGVLGVVLYHIRQTNSKNVDAEQAETKMQLEQETARMWIFAMIIVTTIQRLSRQGEG